MNNLEIMEQEAADRGIEVIDYYFESNRIKALYKNGIIAMNIRMRSYRQRACILAEEIAHHDTNVGNILDQTDVANRKQERRARLLAFDRLIGLQGLIQCFLAGDRNRYEVAERLEVTEEFLADALEMYRGKYGEGKQVGNFWVSFEPYLSIVEIV